MVVPRQVVAVFRQHDKGITRGAFSGVKEKTVARWIERGHLVVICDGQGLPVACVVHEQRKVSVHIRDFTGAIRGTISPGDRMIVRFACMPGHQMDLEQALTTLDFDWLTFWMENPTDRRLCERLGVHPLAVKISASSEIRGIGCRSRSTPFPPLAALDRHTLVRLDAHALDVSHLREAIATRLSGWIQHFSVYNKRNSWTAVALRGYGGRPDFIQKPTEMKRAWKADNVDKMLWKVEDTPLLALLPEAQLLIDQIPGKKERCRLMRLAAHGLLSRHADITNPDSGTGEEKILRIHVPIQTNPDVVFETWGVDGCKSRASMREGEMWYLDTRKPHQASNGGDTDRIHLVCDVYSNPSLLQMITRGRDARTVQM